ncbi:hypothetical protein BGX29_001518, partial [Mortierella sp. GBA35]
HQQADSSNASAAAAAAQQLAQADQPKKAKRKRITPEQLEDLVGLFEKTDTPSFEIRENLAKKLGMTNREIQVWFQNRRAKANRIKINEQAALHHQQHLQQQQMQQHLQGHHHHSHHHRSNSANGFGGHPIGHTVHSAPATPQQPVPGHHHSNSSTSNNGPHSTQESSAYGYFGPNGSSSPPMTMPTVTPRTHSSHSQRGPTGGRRPVSLYDLGSYGHHLQTQQFQQKPGAFQPQQHSASSSSSSSSLYGPASSSGGHGHGHGRGHGHSHSSSFSGAFGMDIIMAKNAPPPTSSSSSSQRPILPPPINSMNQRRTGPGQSFEEFEDTRRQNRHERTMSEGHPAGYMSPTSMSPISPPPERMSDMQYRDEYRETKEESPSSVTHSSPFANGSHTKSNSTSNNRHSTSWSSFGLKAEEMDPPVVPRERPSSAYFASTTKNRRSYDEAQYEEHQQLMRDNFNMDTRLVISEEEPRPESAIDLLAFAAAYVQESEEHKKDGKDNSNSEDKREMAGLLNSSNKRQSFHGPSGYPSKEPYQEEPSSSSTSRYSSSGMTWEASPPAGSSGNTANSNSSNNEVMPIPRRRGGDDGPYVSRRRPVTYGGSGFLYDHHENQFLPQSPSSSLASYSRPSPSSNPRRLSYRSSTESGSSQLLLQRGLTRPRRSSSTAASGIMNHALSASSMTPVLPPILSESNNNNSNSNNRLLSPVMVPSPQFGSSRLTRQDSSQSNGDGMNNTNGNNLRDSPGSDSYSRDSMNDSHNSRDEEMEEIKEEAEMMDESMQRAAKRRSGNFGAMFSYGVGAQ